MTHSAPDLNPSGPDRWRWPAMGVLLLSIIVLGVRGPLPAMSDGVSDLAQIVTATRTWAQGANPYETEQLIATWEAIPESPEATWDEISMSALYPPSLYSVMWLFSWGSWTVIKATWVVVGLISVVALIVSGWRLAQVSLTSTRGLWLAAGICLLAPIQTNFRVGQLGLPVAALVMVGLALLWNRAENKQTLWRWCGAVCLGLAAGVKPQLALPFVAMIAMLGHWREALFAGVTVAGMLAIGVGRYELAGVDWLSGLQAEVHRFVNGGLGDPTMEAPLRWHMINLAHLLHLMTDHRSVVTLISWGLCLAVGLSAVIKIWMTKTAQARDTPILFASLTALLSLLIVYHRLYDASVLALLLVVLLKRETLGVIGKAVVGGLMLLFAVNVPAALMVVAGRGWLPEWITQGHVWQWVLLPIHVWALIGLAGFFWFKIVLQSKLTGVQKDFD